MEWLPYSTKKAAFISINLTSPSDLRTPSIFSPIPPSLPLSSHLVTPQSRARSLELWPRLALPRQWLPSLTPLLSSLGASREAAGRLRAG
jgi:hypothetical protein